jgi:2-polyprenyl-6-methoxyphenol hydroxylase-like FAD-dependent oxidoreductase
MTVIVAGGGIAGLTAALTCHQIGVPVEVFESVRELQPLGVGINLQPNAVRELYDLGLEAELPGIGIEAKEWALVAPNGRDVYAEPRGRLAGYRWPQFSVHRGELQMLLYRAAVDRLGADAVATGAKVTGYRNTPDGIVALVERRDGTTEEVAGTVLLGADGLRSAVRAQMHPDEGNPQWGGAIMWRGTSPGAPIRSGASFTLIGTMDHRFIHYPISEPDPATGLQTQNWIAELTYDPAEWPEDLMGSTADWNQRVPIDKFIEYFEPWRFDWLDVPALIRRAEAVFEYPSVDRDPVDRWVDGRAALIGDAAHVMYPTGSNGASQAIVDARVLGAAFVAHGVGPDALVAYEDELLEPMSALVLRNRGAGPIAILGLVEERCGGEFDNIDDVLAPDEVDEFMAGYKAAAGLAIDALNAAQPIIAPGSRV